jgi:kinesin family protein 6/9
MSRQETVKVCIRSRPTSNFPAESLRIDPQSAAISIHQAKPQGQLINNQQEDWNFKFNHVLQNVNQQVVYDTCASDIVDSCLEGYNGTILAYGQTGAGKTFTMIGGNDFKLRGIAPRAISHVFRVINDRPHCTFEVKISYLEIYTEQYYDLLNDNTTPLGDLAVRDDERGSVFVKGLQKPIVNSEEEALALLFQGETNRAVGEHQMNRVSTRSHCVFTIYIQQRSRIESSAKVIHSKLNLVDLAGSERVGKTASRGQTLQEAKYINKSLSFLEQVVVALATRTREHIPFRQSKLTNVLRDSLGGNCKTRLIANIWSEREQLDETISTLKFATRMMRVHNNATLNVQLDPQALVKQYAREIKQLRQELAMHDTLANREKNVSYEPFTPEQQAEIRSTVRRFAEGETASIEVVNLRQINEVFVQFKQLVQEYKDQAGTRSDGGASQRTLGARPASSRSGHGSRGPNDGPVYVGDIDPLQGGFNVGSAPLNARPASPLTSSPSRSPTKPTQTKTQTQPRRRSIVGSPPRQRTADEIQSRSIGGSYTTSSDARAVAFQDFKRTEGSEINEQYTQFRADLAAKRQELKGVTSRVNLLTKQISNCNAELKSKRNSRAQEESRPRFAGAPEYDDGVEVIDEEEFRLIQTCKTLKRDYNVAFARRRSILEEVSQLKAQADEAKLNLASAFMKAHADDPMMFRMPTDTGSGTRGVQDRTIDLKTSQLAATRTLPRARSRGDDNEQLDVGEQFEQLEMQRIMAEHPDSLSFYNAQKNTLAQAHKKTRLQGSRKPVGNTRPRMRV